MRKSYSGKLKAKIAVEVIMEQDTLAEISSKFEVHRVSAIPESPITY